MAYAGINGRPGIDYRLRTSVLLAGVCFGAVTAHATDGTWLPAPATADWNTGTNWTSSPTVPDGTASFGPSTRTSLTFSQLTTTIGTLQFNAGAPAYTFTLVEQCTPGCSIQTLNVTTAGVVNNAASAPTFTLRLGSVLNFKNASPAANASMVMREGDLVFLNTSNAGSAVVTTPDAMHIGTVTFRNSSSAGTANFTMVGSTGLGSEGTVFFLDTSTAANATFTNNPGLGSGGTTQFGTLGGTDTSNAGTAGITNNSNGVANFLAATSALNATIVNNNGGGTNFQDNASAANATITNNAGGSLFFGDNATAASARITNNASLIFGFGFTGIDFGDTATAANATIVNNSGGVIQFYDSTTAGNATITTASGASLQFFQNATAGNATVTTNSGGDVKFFENSTGGGARFITNAGGTFDVSGLTSAGMTAGSIEGAGSYVLGSKALTVGGNNLSTTVSGVISGIGGSLVKTGTGTLTLSGNSTYTGGTTISAGALIVNGAIASAVTVGNGATLGGGGRIGGLSAASGGVVAPGNSIGTLNVSGPVSFAAGSTYQVEANAAGQADAIVATGAATLNGGTVQVLAANGNYSPSKTYTILTAASRTGTFANVTSNFAFLTPTLTYDPIHVFLTLTQNAFSSAARTRNQTAAANALDASPFGSALVQAVLPLTASQALQAFDALSGEIYPSSAGMLLNSSSYMRNAMLGRMRQTAFPAGAAASAGLAAGGPALAYQDSEKSSAAADAFAAAFPTKAPAQAPTDRGLTFWAHGLGAWGSADSNGNAASLRSQVAGAILGVDTSLANAWRAGMAAGYTQLRVNVDDRLSSATIDSAHVGGYAAGPLGAFNVRTGAAVAFHSVGADRNIAFSGFSDRASARFNGTTGQVFGEIGYGMRLGSVAAEPFAGLAWAGLRTNSFSETGGSAALNVAGMAANIGYSSLGVRAAARVPLANGTTLLPRATLAWQNAFGDVTPTAGLSFASTGAGFTVAGVPLARNSALVEAGADLAFRPTVKAGLFYSGELAKSTRSHAVTGRFTWTF